MNNQVIQNGGVKERGTGLFRWGPSNAYWGKEFELFTQELGNVDSTKQIELQRNPTRNPKNMTYMNTGDFTIVLEDGKKLKEIKKFLTNESGERISELTLYSIVEEFASDTHPYPIDIKVSESIYNTNSPSEQKQELIDRVQKVYDLFKDVMSTIPSGEGAGRRLDELIAKVNDYLYGNSRDYNLLSLSHGVKQTQYRPDSSLPWTDYQTGEFKIWSSNEGMYFSVGDVLYWLISYLQFYKSFPLKGKGKKLDGSEMPYTWKQLNALNTGSNELTIEEEIKQGQTPKRSRFRLWINYMKHKRTVIMKNRKDYIEKSLTTDTLPLYPNLLKKIHDTSKILPLWYFNSTYEQNPGQLADQVLETYLNKYSTIIIQRNKNKDQVDSIMTELSGKQGDESNPAQVNVESKGDSDSDSDSDSDDSTIVPAGSKLKDTTPGSIIELETYRISKSEDQDKKNEILKKLNFVEVPVADDGDCLFEAMSLFLKYNVEDEADKTNKQLRKQIIDEISNNWDQYKEFIMLREGCDDQVNRESPEQLTNWCKTPENYKQMMMVSRDENGNFPNWYVPLARFGGLEEMKVFGELYNTPVKLYVIDEADKKLSNQYSSPPIEGRQTANFLFDPIKGHYSLLNSIPTSETKRPTDIVVADTSKKLFFDKYLEWLKQSHPRQ